MAKNHRYCTAHRLVASLSPLLGLARLDLLLPGQALKNTGPLDNNGPPGFRSLDCPDNSNSPLGIHEDAATRKRNNSKSSVRKITATKFGFQ